MTRRGSVLLLVLGLCVIAGAATSVSGAGEDSPSADGSVVTEQDIWAMQTPPARDEVLLWVTIGPDVRAQRALALSGDVDPSTYRTARASAKGSGKRSPEANVQFFDVVERPAFKKRGVVSMNFYRRAARFISVHVPYQDESVDRAYLSKLPLPKFARGAVRSLIDTSTGEIVWADE
ncbi:MAG TPA: hypothetical protein VD790_10110 [Thermoleophilaceae bacterium]|nr:hypothetical protein [Thermoleophilaceae bacterium]